MLCKEIRRMCLSEFISRCKWGKTEREGLVRAKENSHHHLPFVAFIFLVKIWYRFVWAKEYKQEHTDCLFHKPLQWQELLPAQTAVPPVTTLKDSATHRDSFISDWWALHPEFPPSHCQFPQCAKVVPWEWAPRDSNYGTKENKNLKGSLLTVIEETGTKATIED